MASRIMSMPTSSHTQSKLAANRPTNLNLANQPQANSATASKVTIGDEFRSTNNKLGARWNLGLINTEGKYLTAENFGFKINATGNSLRKKQKWSIEQDNDEFVYLLSPLGCYLSTDKYGKVNCEKTASDNDCKFLLEPNSDGKWAFKSASYGYYFAGSGDRLHCFSKNSEFWTVHLAIHPQVGTINFLK